MTSKPTISLDAFLPVYDENDNVWWTLDPGDHQNLFDEAIKQLAQAREREREARIEAFNAINANRLLQENCDAS